MRSLEEKIKEEIRISKQLREDAWKVKPKNNSIDKAKAIREEQQKHYDKFIFYKNLKKELEKKESEK